MLNFKGVVRLSNLDIKGGALGDKVVGDCVAHFPPNEDSLAQ